MAKQYGSNSPYPGDKINGKLEKGEYVMNRNVLAIPGMKEYLDKLNYEVAPRYARGGEVNGYALGGLASWSKSLFDKFKAPMGPTTAGDYDLRNMTPAARKMATKDIATQPLKKQLSSEADFQGWAGRPSDFAAGETAFNTSDEEDFQEGFGGPSITSKYMKEEATPDYMKDSLLSKLRGQGAETEMPSLGEEADFFAQEYGSAPKVSEEPEAATAVDSDPHGIFKASEDYNPLAEEAPQKMGLKESLRGFGEKAGQFGRDAGGALVGGAGLVAGGIGGAHKYLGAGKADKYEDVLTGKAKGSLYQRAGKGLGMLSSLMSEFAAPGMGRGNLKGYGRYKDGETPALKDVAPSEEVKKADEPKVKPENQKLDLDKDISKEIADRDKVVLEESVADDDFGTDYNEVGADTTAEERLRIGIHEGDVGVSSGELTDESLGTDMSASSTAVNQNLDLSGGVEPDPWFGSDIDYSLNPTEVVEEEAIPNARGGLIGRAYQNGGYAHSNLDYMISLNHYQDGGMVSGNNSRRMFDFMKTRRY